MGSLHDTHHGMTNAVFMPYVLAANREAIEEKIERLAAYCGLEPSFDAFMAAIKWDNVAILFNRYSKEV